MSENLVFVGKIISLDPIENADFILAATVVCGQGGKWRGVVKKSDFNIGSQCKVYLPDSIVPKDPELKFMEASNWRVRMRRFKGVPSEVLIMPLHPHFEVGQDITEMCGVTKYFKPVPSNLAGKIKGNFPKFIRKTDEPNYQRSEELIQKLIGHPYYITEKADGSSTTAYKYKGEFGVCSRNLELLETEDNGYWEIANRYDLRNKLPEGFALQWESCGPKIQKNPMNLQKIEGFAFSVWNIIDQKYLGLCDFLDFCKKLAFPTVKILDVMPSYISKDLSEIAKGKYSSGKNREGIVIRSQNLIDGELISFKVINLDYE